MTESERSAIKRMWDAGVSQEKIIQTMPMSRTAAIKVLKTLRYEGFLPPRKRKRGQVLVAEAYRSGITNPYELSEKYGYTIKTVAAYLRSEGIQRKRGKRSWKEIDPSERTKKIRECLENGASMSEVARMFNVSRQWVFIVKERYLKDEL